MAIEINRQSYMALRSALELELLDAGVDSPEPSRKPFAGPSLRPVETRCWAQSLSTVQGAQIARISARGNPNALRLSRPDPRRRNF